MDRIRGSCVRKLQVHFDAILVVFLTSEGLKNALNWEKEVSLSFTANWRDFLRLDAVAVETLEVRDNFVKTEVWLFCDFLFSRS